MNELLDAALAYAKERGWPVFPCRADKTPYTSNGVLDATTNLKVIEDWWNTWPRANIGLDVGGAGMMVLDLDPGHDLKELEKNVGVIPNTKLSANSPRGGSHLFFSINGTEIVSPSASKLAANIDVRSFNSYVLLAPSVTKDGSYTWISEGKPAHRTDEMVRVANSHREKHEDRNTWLIEADLTENVASAVKWLQSTAKVSIEGQGGDSMAYATAAHMKSFGISKELAFDLIWEHWNPRCVPPWGSDEADHLASKVENGYSYNTSPPGNMTPAYHTAKAQALFKPVTRSFDAGGKEYTTGRFRFVDRWGMDEIKPPSWLVKDFLPERAYAILFGSPGTFKTFVALDIALSIANGYPTDPLWEVTKPGPVLFAAGEGRATLTKRVAAWEKIHWNGKKSNDFILGDPVPHINEEIEPFIEGALLANPDGYKLIVIDTIGRSMQGVNENAQEHASKFTHLVEQLQYNLGATVLALHHTGHTEKGRERGSIVFGADADTRIRIDRPTKRYLIDLTMVKQKDAQEWNKPKLIQLNEITLSAKLKSLVAVNPDKAAVEQSQNDRMAKTTRSKHLPVSDPVVMRHIDKAISEILFKNKPKTWTQSDLAEALAMRDDIDLSSSHMRKNTLYALREDSLKLAKRLYDPIAKKWRYKEV